MAARAECKTVVVLDASKPNGVLGESLQQAELSEIIGILEEIKKKSSFELEVFSPSQSEVLKLSRIHLGKSYRETHCFRGYPIHGSIRQFHKYDSDYILHLDSDMLFHETEGFSWIKSGVELMEQNSDIACVLPRGGPPPHNGSLHQGTTEYRVDEKREIYLFKNFTSRHYLAHRKRFLELLPMKPRWLSWREPFKSRLFGNGKMLCWEVTVTKAIEKSNYWRADLASPKAWSLHPPERGERFNKYLPEIIKLVEAGFSPEEQLGHYDLNLDWWEGIITKSPENV